MSVAVNSKSSLLHELCPRRHILQLKLVFFFLFVLLHYTKTVAFNANSGPTFMVETFPEVCEEGALFTD